MRKLTSVLLISSMLSFSLAMFKIEIALEEYYTPVQTTTYSDEAKMGSINSFSCPCNIGGVVDGIVWCSRWCRKEKFD